MRQVQMLDKLEMAKLVSGKLLTVQMGTRRLNLVAAPPQRMRRRRRQKVKK